MATKTKTGIGESVKRVWAELDYAQRRLFEIRTGVPVTSPAEREHPATTVEELDSLYALDEDKLAA
jgi:hypothetical protein